MKHGVIHASQLITFFGAQASRDAITKCLVSVDRSPADIVSGDEISNRIA